MLVDVTINQLEDILECQQKNGIIITIIGVQSIHNNGRTMCLEQKTE